MQVFISAEMIWYTINDGLNQEFMGDVFTNLCMIFFTTNNALKNFRMCPFKEPMYTI